MKVITITLNPSLDKTYRLNGLFPGKLNRVQTVIEDAAGKGINVTKNLTAWGVNSIALGFLGGYVGNRMKELLESVISYDMIDIDGITRTNIKVNDEVGQELTEINEPGPILSEMHLSKLLETLQKHVSIGDVVVLSGSAPKGFDPSVYRTLVNESKSLGAFVVLDADKEAFNQGIQAIPSMIKPNEVEVQWALELNEPCTLEQLIDFGKEKVASGVQWVVISRGKDGALFISDNEIYVAKGLKVEVKSPIGAGDAMVSGMVLGKYFGWDFKKTALVAMAASVATVCTEGTKTAQWEEIVSWFDKIHIERWS